MKEGVLDASALLALLQEETGSGNVCALLPGVAMSTVNLAEVVGKLAVAGMPEETIQRALGTLGLDLMPFDELQSYRAGLPLPHVQEYGLSLGDRACLALGLHMGRPIYTADKAWGSLKLGVEIHIIR